MLKRWQPTPQECVLIAGMLEANRPKAAIAKRMGVSETRLKRFEARLISARQSMPPPAPRARPTTVPERSWLDRLLAITDAGVHRAYEALGSPRLFHLHDKRGNSLKNHLKQKAIWRRLLGNCPQ